MIWSYDELESLRRVYNSADSKPSSNQDRAAAPPPLSWERYVDASVILIAIAIEAYEEYTLYNWICVTRDLE